MNASDPRLILICCEGSTEENYFNIVVKARHISPALVPLAKTFGRSHTTLIDVCAKERADESQKYDMPEDEIEVWAVFDKDHWRNGFTRLERYAQIKNVKLAYSDPQFETYLLQHLSQDSLSLSGDQLENYLSQQINQSSFTDSKYHSYNKPELDWLADLLDSRPRTLETAITNSNVRNNRTRTPFLTVHNLTERLLQFEPK